MRKYLPWVASAVLGFGVGYSAAREPPQTPFRYSDPVMELYREIDAGQYARLELYKRQADFVMRCGLTLRGVEPKRVFDVAELMVLAQQGKLSKGGLSHEWSPDPRVWKSIPVMVEAIDKNKDGVLEESELESSLRDLREK